METEQSEWHASDPQFLRAASLTWVNPWEVPLGTLTYSSRGWISRTYKKEVGFICEGTGWRVAAGVTLVCVCVFILPTYHSLIRKWGSMSSGRNGRLNNSLSVRRDTLQKGRDKRKKTRKTSGKLNCKSSQDLTCVNPIIPGLKSLSLSPFLSLQYVPPAVMGKSPLPISSDL